MIPFFPNPRMVLSGLMKHRNRECDETEINSAEMQRICDRNILRHIGSNARPIGVFDRLPASQPQMEPETPNFIPIHSSSFNIPEFIPDFELTTFGLTPREFDYFSGYDNGTPRNSNGHEVATADASFSTDVIELDIQQNENENETPI